MSYLETSDPEIAAAIAHEVERQRSGIELIASENYTSAAVMEAVGSVLTNKYAEGYSGRRYYGGCEFVDVAETLAIERARRLFDVAHVNVQPHSGAQANMAVYFGLLEMGDTVLAMSLTAGGHLTHGSPVNFSGRFYKIIPYGVRQDNERIDYDELERLAIEHKPRMILAGATAYSRIIDFPRFREIADRVGAYLWVDMAHFAGLVAGGQHPSPVPYAHVVSSTTHKTLRGPRGGFICTNDAEIGQKIDKNVFPGLQGGPLMHVIAGKAVCFGEALQPEFADYARRVVENARVLAEELSRQGLRIVSGGTDNHLMLVDLTATGATGKAAEKLLDEAGITVNKNTIPYDTRSPFVTSGIRLGSPAVTTRGFGPDEMRRIGKWIAAVLQDPADAGRRARIRAAVRELTSHFPIPGVPAAALAY